MKYWNPEFLEKLLQIQDTDLKIRNLENQIQTYYQRSKEEDSELSQLKAEVARVDQTIEATESQHQMYSTTLEDIKTAIKGLLTTKSGAPKPRTRSSTEALRIEEDKLGVLVEETLEQLQACKAERAVFVEKAEARALELEKTQEGPEAEIRKLQLKIKRFERQREEQVVGIPTMLLRRYDRLRSSRSGIGLTVLRDGVCTVCRMQMPTAVISRMTQGERISMCPACGRMVAKIEIINLIATSEDAKAEKKAKTKKALAKKVLANKKAAEKKQKAAAKKAEAKGVTKKKVVKAPSKETPATETDSIGKPAAKKLAAKKPAAKKAPAKTPAKKARAKTPAKKAPAKTPAVKEAPAKKPAAKKAPAKKPAAKKPPAKKPAAKKKK